MTDVGRLPVRGEVISGPGNFEIEVPARPSAARQAAAHRQPQGADPRRGRRAKTPAANATPEPPASRRPTSPSQLAILRWAGLQ